MRNKFHIYTFCLLLITGNRLPITFLNAQDFEVAPVKMLYDCEPGQIQTKTLYIRNHANQKQQFNVVAVDLPADSLGKKKTSENKSCKDWITLNPSFFDLNPNEQKEVKVVMQVPPGHSETRWCMVFVSATEEQTALSADKQMKGSVKVKPRIGVKVIQSPKSNINYKGAISNLKETTLPADTLRTFQANISNTGDKVIEGKIYLVFSNLETAKEIKEKPQRITVLPGATKKITLIMPPKIPAGKYSLAAILDYGNNSALEAVQMNVEVK
ncbi:MAG: hypothetical protein HY841_05970 [Bacteroidetes bacterium]|nr:hypothetical protein [Bacteroidota bacterium]